MCLLAISGRKHYTVDLYLGVVVSSLVFSRFQYSWAGGRRKAPRCPTMKSESSKCDVDLQGPSPEEDGLLQQV